MDRHVGALLRWTRAAMLAAVAVLSGVVAHVSADGLLPGWFALTVLYLTCCGTAAALLGRPASTLRVVVLLVAGQTFIHGALTAMSGHRGDPPLTRASPTPTVVTPALPTPSGGGQRVGSLYDQMYAGRPVAPTQLVLPAPVQHLVADLTGPHALMALAHLGAAAVLGWWLARGERLLWSLLELTAAGVDELGSTLLRFGACCAHLATLVAGTDNALLRLARTRGFGPPRAVIGRGAILGTQLVRRGPPVRAVLA